MQWGAVFQLQPVQRVVRVDRGVVYGHLSALDSLVYYRDHRRLLATDAHGLLHGVLEQFTDFAALCSGLHSGVFQGHLHPGTAPKSPSHWPRGLQKSTVECLLRRPCRCGHFGQLAICLFDCASVHLRPGGGGNLGLDHRTAHI